MHLISVLMVGVPAAASGTVTLYRRGTATIATAYTTFEGDGALTAENVALDDSGATALYVNEVVRVLVKDSNGGTVREFVDGAASSAVEVRSLAFEGAAYSGGAIAAGNPTTVKDCLDKWLTSAGATDFEVNVGGAAKTLQAAFGAVAGLRLYVASDPAYGAAGDGVTDDTAAVNAAIAAAYAAGGGVVFLPAGSYVISGALTTYASVSLEGAGSDVTTIRVSSSSASLVSGLSPFRVSGVSIAFANSPYTGTLFNITSSSEVLGFRPVFEDVYFARTGTCSGTLFASTVLNVVTFRRCRMPVITTGICVVGSLLTSLGIFECELVATGAGAYTGGLIRSAGGLQLANSILAMVGTPATAGTYIDNDGRAVVTGCMFFAPASGSCTVFDSNNALATLTESGNDVSNILASSVTFSMYTFDVAALPVSKVSSRDNAFLNHPTPNTAALAIDLLAYGTVFVDASNTGARTYTFPRAPFGAKAVLRYSNQSGSAVAISFTNAGGVSGADLSVPAGAAKLYTFIAYDNGGSIYWVCTSVYLPKEISP